MSEMIHGAHKNLDPARQHHLKRLITDLHKGRDAEEVKKEFQALFQGVSSEEIAAMEAALVSEGMAVEEIQKLCDIHAAIMGSSVADVHKPKNALETPGHPLHQLEMENKALEELIDGKVSPAIEAFAAAADEASSLALLDAINALMDVDKHYLRKENLIFPFLEKAGITAPPKVMWGVHDEIRAALKGAKFLAAGKNPDAARVSREAAQKIVDMIFKERNILFPMAMNALSEDDWIKVEQESDGLGYCLVAPGARWIPLRAVLEMGKDGERAVESGHINLGTGVLKPGQIELMLNSLPFDVTFIDEHDVVRYFSGAKDRIFPRNKTVIGRLVQNCHPPKSMGVVEKILDDFKSGAKDHEDFWIKMGGKMVYIRYFAVRDSAGKYAGTVEVTQEVSEIRSLEGEKRIMS